MLLRARIGSRVALLALLAGHAHADSLGPGTLLSTFTIQDQHGRPHRVDEQVDAILFARDMDASRRIDAALRERNATLEDGRVIWISDISGMPRLISQLVAVPSMRRRPYVMLLDHDGALTRDFPGSAGKVTLLRLQDLRITGVEELGSAEALGATLGTLLQPQETPPERSPP